MIYLPSNKAMIPSKKHIKQNNEYFTPFLGNLKLRHCADINPILLHLCYYWICK